MTYLLIFTILTLLLSTYFHSITAITQDLGRHILLGEIILNTGIVPSTNLFSYTYPDFPFINHHWFSEVIFYLIYTLSGFTGILFLTAGCFIAAFLLQFFLARKTHIFALSFVSFLSLGILYERTDVRPEAFSMLLFSVFLFILYKNREKPTKWLYALIPLQLLWVNLHVYFPIGILVIGLFLIDYFCHSWLDQESSRSRIKSGMTKKQWSNETIKQSFPLLLVLIGCCVITLLNPNGLSGALYPLRVFENYGYAIEENQDLFFLWQYFPKRTIAFFGITTLLLFTTLLLRFKHTRLIDWLLAIVFSVLAIQAERNVSLFVLAVFLPFSTHLTPLFSRLDSRFHGNDKKENSIVIPDLFTLKILFLGIRNLFPLFILALLIWQLFYVVQTKPPSITTPNGAEKAADFVLGKNIPGPFFNNFDIGSYFLFRLYPKEKVFVDGRPEAYPADFFQKTYIPMQENSTLFATVDKQYNFNAIFFAHTDQTPWAQQFLKDIIKNPQWKSVYLDDTVIVFVKTNQQNKHLQAIDLETYHASSSSIEGLYQLFVFFQKIENLDRQLATAKMILQKNPNDCFALAMLSNYYAQRQDPLINLYAPRFEQYCR